MTAESPMVWSGSVRLAGEFLVPEGRVLSIRPGTRVAVAPDGELRVAGRLEAEGAEGAEIVFAPEGLWGGIVLSGSASATVSRAELAGGSSGDLIRCADRAGLRLSHCRLKGAGNGLRCEGDSAAAAVDCEILEAKAVGILAGGRARVEIDACLLGLNETAVTLHDAAFALIRGSRLCVNEFCGLNAMARARALLRRCELVGNHTGLSLSGSARADVFDTVLRRNEVGAFATDRSALNVVGNDFEQNRSQIDLVGEARVSALLEAAA